VSRKEKDVIITGVPTSYSNMLTRETQQSTHLRSLVVEALAKDECVAHHLENVEHTDVEEDDDSAL
jgi:hypothetical protein